MISEGSRDTEEWIHLCITGINYILKYITLKKHVFKIVIIFHDIGVFILLLSDKR